MFERIVEYRFIYIELDHLITEYPPLGPTLREITTRGMATAKRLCGQLVIAGCLNADEDEIDVLATQMMLTATCWFTFTRVLPETEPQGPGRAAYQVLSLLAPYLAERERIYLDYLRRKYRA